jgi:crotonobetainyl-CoA:carnitine CoA-transferase CaiB-like acyl-CoA transferase
MTTTLEKSIAEQGTKALDRFDQCVVSYEQLASGASGRGKEFALDVARERLLALYGKRQLASRLNQTDVAEATLAKAKEIMDPLIQQDPTFAQTVTAQLFTGLQGYKPQMAIDIDLYYEGILKQFQNWRKLKGPEAQAEVDKLLASLDDMSKKESPALMEKLKPEWDALKAAKEKGFTVDETAGDPNTPSIQPLTPQPPR